MRPPAQPGAGVRPRAPTLLGVAPEAGKGPSGTNPLARPSAPSSSDFERTRIRTAPEEAQAPRPPSPSRAGIAPSPPRASVAPSPPRVPLDDQRALEEGETAASLPPGVDDALAQLDRARQQASHDVPAPPRTGEREIVEEPAPMTRRISDGPPATALLPPVDPDATRFDRGGADPRGHTSSYAPMPAAAPQGGSAPPAQPRSMPPPPPGAGRSPVAASHDALPIVDAYGPGGPGGTQIGVPAAALLGQSGSSPALRPGASAPPPPFPPRGASAPPPPFPPPGASSPAFPPPGASSPAFPPPGASSPAFPPPGASSPAFPPPGASSPAFPPATGSSPAFSPQGAPLQAPPGGPPYARGPSPPTVVALPVKEERTLFQPAMPSERGGSTFRVYTADQLPMRSQQIEAQSGSSGAGVKILIALVVLALVGGTIAAVLFAGGEERNPQARPTPSASASASAAPTAPPVVTTAPVDTAPPATTEATPPDPPKPVGKPKPKAPGIKPPAPPPNPYGN